MRHGQKHFPSRTKPSHAHCSAGLGPEGSERFTPSSYGSGSFFLFCALSILVFPPVAGAATRARVCLTLRGTSRARHETATLCSLIVRCLQWHRVGLFHFRCIFFFALFEACVKPSLCIISFFHFNAVVCILGMNVFKSLPHSKRRHISQ